MTGIDTGAGVGGFHLRRAEPDDAAAILAYLRQMGSETTFVTFGAEGIPLDEAAEARFIAGLEGRDNAIFLLAVAPEGIVGALSYVGGEKSRTRHTGEFGVSVLRDWYGRGVGRALLEAMIAWARRGGVVRKINLRVHVENARAIRLYERLGWVHEGRSSRDLLMDGQFHDSFLMGLEIDPAPSGEG